MRARRRRPTRRRCRSAPCGRIGTEFSHTSHISAATALRLLNVVKDKGKAIVCQGKAEDMKMMAGLFGEVGMKTTVAAGSAPYK